MRLHKILEQYIRCRKVCAFLLSFFLIYVLHAQVMVDAGTNLGVYSVQSIDDDLANGMSFYDYNQDGWDDLTMPSGQNTLVFYRNDSGTFIEESLLTVHTGNIRQVLWIDYNADTYLDLFVSYYDQGVRLYENNGTFNFTDVTQQVGITTTAFKSYGVAFADPDGDFDLDIYICAYTLTAGSPNLMRNLYYENDGTNTFIEKAQSLGIDNGYQPSFMPVWYDFDNDGDVDLQVINDREYTSDAFYVNNGNGQFTEQSAALGISNAAHSPMSCTIGDFNNDTYFDVFESDLANGGVENGLPTNYKVFQNNGGLGFTNTAPLLGVDTNFFAWGGLWVDYNNDCFEDLYIATAENDATGFSERPSVFYKNLGGNAFQFANDSLLANVTHTSYSPVKGDINNDGFYDIAVLNGSYNPHNILLNLGNENNYIKITPQSTVSNTQAIGGRIEVFANGEHQSRMILSSDGMCAQSSQHAIFGLGTATFVDSIKVTFPSGLTTVKYGLNANQSVTIIEQIAVQVSLGTQYMEACPGEVLVLEYPGLANYVWNDGSTGSSFNVTQSGSYAFTAENQLGDTIFFLAPITVDYEPEPIVSHSVINNPCGISGEGSIELIVSPAQIVNVVTWSNGVMGMQNENLPSGNYNYEITTLYDCVYSGGVWIETEPELDLQCLTTPYTDTSGGSVAIFVWGGVFPFQFEMNSLPVENTISDLTPGNYTVVVVDQNGCTDSVSFEILNHATADVPTINTHSFSVRVNNNHISIIDANITPGDVEVYDIFGKKYRLFSVRNQKNGVQFELSVAPGIYQVRTDRWTQIITILDS